MSVAVLNRHHVLHNQFQGITPHPPRIKHPRKPNPSPNRATRAQPNRRKRCPNTSPPPRAAAATQTPPKNLVMGQVKILKRGEQPTETTTPDKASKAEDPDLSLTDRIGQDLELVPTRLNGFYAGSAFITSPPPSSLPLPVFFMKKNDGVNNHDATSDLCRILRLNLQ